MATSDMSFGMNENINYVESKEVVEPKQKEVVNQIFFHYS